MSTIENGQFKNWEKPSNLDGQDLEDWYEKYLKKYIKAEVKYKKIGDGTNNRIVLFFNDGSITMIGVTWIFFADEKEYKKMKPYGDNGRVYPDLKTSGIKWFTFDWNDIGMEPYAYEWNNTVDDLYNNTNFGCNKDNSGERAYCAKIIQMNGWKIPDDYPFKF